MWTPSITAGEAAPGALGGGYLQGRQPPVKGLRRWGMRPRRAAFNEVLLDIRGEQPERPHGKFRRPAERPQAIRNQRNIWETAEAKRPGHEVPEIRDGLRFPSSTLAIPPAPKSKENAMIKSALVVTAAAFAALAAIVPAAYAISPCF